MSQWRREASERLPEFQQIIASPSVDNPMMLWIELNLKFEKLCEEIPQPIDLLTRIWQYASWCLSHRSDDVSTAAALGFCEHLIQTAARVSTLPKLMSRTDFLGLRELLECHHTPDEVDRVARTIWK